MKILYPLAKRFIAGHNFDSAKPKIQRLMNEVFEVSIDYLGELSKNQKDCEKARDQYLEIIDFYKDQKINISIDSIVDAISCSCDICWSHCQFVFLQCKHL